MAVSTQFKPRRNKSNATYTIDSRRDEYYPRMVWHPGTQSYVESMARVQLDYFLTTAEMTSRCKMCRNTVVPEIIKRRAAYTDHEMVVAEFEVTRKNVRQRAPTQ